MQRLRLATAGESHGPALMGILEGFPFDAPIDADALQRDMARRQGGSGRSVRMKKEPDAVRILGGLRHGRTLGSPIGFVIDNAVHAKWTTSMAPFGPPDDLRPITAPRPGHADLAGMARLGIDDARPVLERASARETAARVAAGALCRQLLRPLGVEVTAHVVRIGDVEAKRLDDTTVSAATLADLRARLDDAPSRCADDEAGAAMDARVARAREERDTLGGQFEIVAARLPAGLGGYATHRERLDARLAGALMSIPAIKAVEVGLGTDVGRTSGADVHDVITRDAGAIARPTNRAGGIEGGMTNGAPLVVRVSMKPLPTLMRPLATVDMRTGEEAEAHRERADVCAVPAAAVVGEAMVCLVLADAALERTGAATFTELQERWPQ